MSDNGGWHVTHIHTHIHACMHACMHKFRKIRFNDLYQRCGTPFPMRNLIFVKIPYEN